MGDDVVLDAVVNCDGDDAAAEKIGFGMVGPEANDAIGPAWRHAGNFQQIIQRGVIDVCARLGRRRRSGCAGHSPRVPVVILRRSGRANT